MVAHNDVEQITALLHEYAVLLDAGDFDGVAALFAHAELSSSTDDRVRRGVAEARALYDDVIVYEDGTPRTMHQLTNVTVQLDSVGSTATARSYFTVLQLTDRGLHPIIGGEYRDGFERVHGAWRFARRQFRPILIGDLSAHMRRSSHWLP